MPAAISCFFGEPRSSTIGSSAAASSAAVFAVFDRLGDARRKLAVRSASSFRNFMRSLPLAAASFSRSTKTGVRLCLPALIASARPAAASTVKPITVS